MADKAERKARAQRAPEGAAQAAKAGKGERAAKGKPEAAPAPQVPRVPARLRERYRTEIVSSLMKEFSYRNRMQVPEVTKVVINMGLGEAVGNVKVIDAAVEELSAITGQKPVVTRARKSEAAFKLRAGMPIGCKVTLRGERMYEFLDRLTGIVLPRVRDFKGLPPNSFDGRGNYTLGLKDQLVFPEIDYTRVDKIKGMNITLTTTARNDEEGRELLRLLGVPLRS